MLDVIFQLVSDLHASTIITTSALHIRVVAPRFDCDVTLDRVYISLAA